VLRTASPRCPASITWLLKGYASPTSKLSRKHAEPIGDQDGPSLHPIGNLTHEQRLVRDSVLLSVSRERTDDAGWADKAEPFPLSDKARIGVGFLFWVYRSSAEYTGSAINS
jgi:hypothetical protein